MFINTLRLLLACCLLSAIAGCNSKPPMAAVTGSVNVAGKPLPGGRILFEPVGGGEGVISAMGDIQSDGTFELFTAEPGDGVAPGTYYPVVMDPKEDDEQPGTQRGPRIGVVQLDKILFEVTADGPNDFEVPITKADIQWAVEDD